MDDDAVHSVGQAYCAAEPIPSIGLANYLFSVVSSIKPAVMSTTTSSATHSVVYADPIGNETDASYYYTPKVTDSAA